MSEKCSQTCYITKYNRSPFLVYMCFVNENKIMRINLAFGKLINKKCLQTHGSSPGN